MIYLQTPQEMVYDNENGLLEPVGKEFYVEYDERHPAIPGYLWLYALPFDINRPLLLNNFQR